jgi:hypothetical protein
MGEQGAKRPTSPSFSSLVRLPTPCWCRPADPRLPTHIDRLVLGFNTLGRVMTRRKLRRSGIALLVDFAAAAVGGTVALSLHWGAGGAFSPWANYISDLSVGQGGSNIVFIVVMVLMALTSGWFFVDSAGSLKRLFGMSWAVNAGMISGIVHSIAAIVMVFFPLDLDRPGVYQVHLICAVLLFLGVAVYTFAYGTVVRRGSATLNLAAVFAGVASVLALLFTLLLILTPLTATLSPHPVTYLVEWATLGMYMVWVLIGGIGVLRLAKRV